MLRDLKVLWIQSNLVAAMVAPLADKNVIKKLSTKRVTETNIYSD